MKITVLFLVTLFSILMLGTNQAKASHMMGADISYTHISKNKYKITLSFYRDCQGIPAPTSPSIKVHNSCKNYDLSLSLTKTQATCDSKFDSSMDASGLCRNYTKKSTCYGGTYPGVQKCTYTGTIDLGDTCKDWVFSYTDCCRNSAITNLSSSSSTSMYIEAHLNNTYVDGHNNSSSIFTTKPVPYCCVGSSFAYNQGAFDPNGDSLVYTMFVPFSTDGKTHVTYGTGFGATTTSPPISCTGSFVFDSKTGQMTFTPSKAQISVLAVRVDEYRKYKGKWVKVGSTERDIQLICIKCNSSTPRTSSITGLNGGFQLDSTTIELCAGQVCHFNFAAVDSDTSASLSVSTNISIVLPKATYSSHSTKKYEDTISFSWLPTGNDTGLHSVVFTFVNDVGCPVPGSATVAYSIYVSPATYAGPDQFLCFGSKKGVQLKAVGGGKFVWSPPDGLNNDSIASPIALPTVTTTYIVTSNLNSACKNKDTVVVVVSPTIPHKVITKDSAICVGDSTTLTALITHVGGYSFKYIWSDTVASNLGSDSFLNIRPYQKTTYFLKSDNGYCPIFDTITVNVHKKPRTLFAVQKPKVCPGVLMNALYKDSIAGAYKFTWNFAGLNSGGITSGPGPITLSSYAQGTYNVTLVVKDTGYLTNCADSSNEEVTIYPKPVAKFAIVDTAGCVNFNVNLKNLSTGLTAYGNQYNWDLGFCNSIDSVPTCSITVPGYYNVKLIVTNGDGCKDTMTKLKGIYVVAYPIASFTSDKRANDTIDLSIATVKYTNTSQFATLYTWNFSDGTGNIMDTATVVPHTFKFDGAFYARLKACDIYGCCDTTRALYTIYNFNDFFVPSAFTPNTDRFNDRLGLLGKYIIKAKLTVYDRWGNLMYTGNDNEVICNYHCAARGWDGTFNGTKCPQGVYIWYAECDMVNGEHIKKKGDVTLIR